MHIEKEEIEIKRLEKVINNQKLKAEREKKKRNRNWLTIFMSERSVYLVGGEFDLLKFDWFLVFFNRFVSVCL